MNIRVGQGFDVHALAPDRKLIIGGVDIPYPLGLLGHSDADVLLHAITDAILGAVGLGDIGKHFPDNNSKYKDANSRILLQTVWETIKRAHWKIGNIDCTIIAEAPKMAPYTVQMEKNIAEDLGIAVEQINIKAKTTEKLGFTGRGEGIAAQAVALLIQLDHQE